MSTLLPELEAELHDAAQRTQPQATAVRVRRTLRPRRRLLLLASVAVAAVKWIGVGAPAPKTTGLGSPVSGPGHPLPGSARLLALRAADPDGGTPWGIRVYKTNRDAACWQVGRVLDGRLGVLGRDGLLGDDGLFHELPVQVDQCRELDGAGRLLAVQNALGLANGTQARLTCRPPTFAPSGGDELAPCPAGSVRLLVYGFLGPRARAATLSTGERVRVDPAQEGAFLFVRRLADPGRAPTPVVTATYADGTRRRVDDAALPGYVDPARGLPSPARVRAPLHVTTARWGARNTVYVIRFRAPVAVRRFGIDYTVLIDGPTHGEGRDCERPLHGQRFGTGGNVRAGKTITIPLTPASALRWNRGWCPGRYRVSVVLHDRAHEVGTFTFTAR
jgi:hypothetical protein